MKIFTKTVMQKKKSILSLFLAAVLMFSFNFVPVSIITNNIRLANAYKSENIQSFYPSTQTGNESNISAGNYPSSLADYFKNSSNNFNILEYYNSRFLELFAKYIHEDYLSTKVTGTKITVGNEQKEYNEVYKIFLSAKGFASIYDYYTRNAAALNSETGSTNFQTYIQYVVTKGVTFSYNNSDVTLPALFPAEGTLGLSQFYQDFAYVLNLKYNSKDIGNDVKNDNEGNLDGLKPDSDFYKDSLAYKELKSFIDAVIEKTVAIYTYDGTVQNKNVMSIFANGAPISRDFYYKDNTFQTLDKPNEPFETKSVPTTVSSNGRATVIYYFGENTNGGDITKETENGYNSSYFSIQSISERNKNILYYRPILKGQLGYIEGYTTYYKYTSIPYEVLSGTIYQLYIHDDLVTTDEKATYDSLFIKAVTSDELEADANRTDNSHFYIQIPYIEGSDGELYFRTLFGLSSSSNATDSYKNFVNLCINASKQSKLYFKLQPSATREVYLVGTEDDKKNLEDANYSYKINLINADPKTFNSDEYFKITTSYSDYYKEGYELYFKKIKEYYTTYDTSDSAYDGYESKASPNIPYEKTTVAAETYEENASGKIIYALVSDDVTDGTVFNFPTIKNAELNRIRNLYIEVPASITKDFDSNYKYYYKHKEIKVNKIFIADDSTNAANNEVYKNLNYTVISTNEYNSNFSNYVAIGASDQNYNKNFKLYYKYDFVTFETDSTGLYVKNLLRKNLSSESNSNKNIENAIYIIDDSLTTTDRNNYKNLNYTVITSTEYNTNSAFYIQIDENDPNYSKTYTKLYYKYNESTASKNPIVYLYSSSSSSNYKTFYKTDADYIAEDYELIPAGDPNFVEGLELYYKKVRKPNSFGANEVKNTYYYYQTSSTISLKANSYYMLSFYVYTNGAEASVYVTDTSNVIKNIKLEGLETSGKWVKYCVFISTDALATSSINIKFYMGNENSIAGNNGDGNTTISGTVLFDDIKVTKINQTDFATYSVDGTLVAEKDEYENSIIIVNKEDIFENVFDNRTKTEIKVNDGSNKTFDNLIDFDAVTNNDVSVLLNNMNFVNGTDGFTPYTELWQYYIGRDVSSQGNEYLLQSYQNAYSQGDVKVSIIDEESIFEDKNTANDDEDNKDEDDEDKKEDEDDVKFVKNTFRENNKILKIENSNPLIALGVASQSFTLKQSMYYKITVWIYSPDKDAKALILVNSNLSTNSTQTNNSTLSVSANVDANIGAYSTEPTNEYGWIPITLFIEGNALHNQDANLVLMADKSSTVYFDNITIEATTSASYDTANSDSDSTTYCLSLAPSSSVITAGVNNGYFNNVNVTNNYKENIDTTLPRAAKNWTVESTNSSNVIAGVVPTSDDYLSLDKNFYKEHGITIPSNHTIKTNVYAVHAPGSLTSSIEGGTGTGNATSLYKFYSSSISLSASNTYKISFEFAKAADFKAMFKDSNGNDIQPKIVANIYYGSVDSAKIISSFSISADEINDTNWHSATFNIATGTSSATVYLELGVENATGTCFFQKVSSKTTTDSLDKIRDDLLSAGSTGDKLVIETIANSRFVDLADSKFTILGEQDSNTGLYKPNDYTIDSLDTSTYTTGNAGVIIADFYSYDIDYKYTVTINKVEYYLKAGDDGVYKLYSNSNCTPESVVEKIDGKVVRINSNNVVTVGTGASETEYSTTKTEIRNYIYSLDAKDENDMIVVGNTFIPKSEFENAQSQNVLVLTNNYSTDYTIATPTYTNSLKTSAYYVLKVYVKTSDFEKENFGLNIAINAISTTFNNINTTSVTSNKDEHGFVCYQVLITTNTSSISNLSVSLSLGSDKNTGKGYALISGIELETFATEKLFNEYAENFEDDETTTKKYFGKVASSNNDDDDTNSEASIWATFFYIFSSILLGIALIVALVAVIIKRHPIKKSKTPKKDDNNEGISVTSSKKSEFDLEEKPTRSRKPKQTSDKNNKDEGFV